MDFSNWATWARSQICCHAWREFDLAGLEADDLLFRPAVEASSSSKTFFASMEGLFMSRSSCCL